MLCLHCADAPLSLYGPAIFIAWTLYYCHVDMPSLLHGHSIFIARTCHLYCTDTSSLLHGPAIFITWTLHCRCMNLVSSLHRHSVVVMWTSIICRMDLHCHHIDSVIITQIHYHPFVVLTGTLHCPCRDPLLSLCRPSVILAWTLCHSYMDPPLSSCTYFSTALHYLYMHSVVQAPVDLVHMV
jgi:hypothetical protein